jgi:hypothetical protein
MSVLHFEQQPAPATVNATPPHVHAGPFLIGDRQVVPDHGSDSATNYPCDRARLPSPRVRACPSTSWRASVELASNAACERAMCGLIQSDASPISAFWVIVHADRAHAALSQLGESSRLETMLRSAYSALYRSTSKSLVAAKESCKNISSLYFPVGHSSGFQIWHSVRASPVGAIDWVDSLLGSVEHSRSGPNALRGGGAHRIRRLDCIRETAVARFGIESKRRPRRKPLTARGEVQRHAGPQTQLPRWLGTAFGARRLACVRRDVGNRIPRHRGPAAPGRR